jgi:hypothetical protein
MARDITAALAAATKADTLRPVLFVELEFSGGTVRFWSGRGEMPFDGKVWTGTGYLGGVSDIEEATEIKASGIRFTLSGLPGEVVAIALDQDYQGRAARVYLGAMSDVNRLISSPKLVFAGQMDVMEISEDPNEAAISLTAENELIDLERPREFRYTPEDQKEYFPGDTFFDFVSSLQDVDVVWGRAGTGGTILQRQGG